MSTSSRYSNKIYPCMIYYSIMAKDIILNRVEREIFIHPTNVSSPKFEARTIKLLKNNIVHV